MQNYNNNALAYAKYLKGKNVIICGPGANLTNKKMGNKINNYDVIVRMNNSYPVNIVNKLNNADVGIRTDVLYHTGAICTCLKQAANQYNMGRIELLVNDKIKWFISKRDPIKGNKRDREFLNKFLKLHDAYEKKYNKNIKLVPVFNEFLGDLQNILKHTDPNMSTIAITHLLTFDIKTLEIIGCDFYSSGYHRYYTLPSHIKWDSKTKSLVRKDDKKRRTPKIPHDYNIQVEFLIDIIKNDDRVKINPSILEKWKKHIKGVQL
jgi:hypothetical protein